MLNDRLTMLDVENTLKTGRIYEPAEERDGLWRYRMHGRNAGVVVAFTGANELSIVTVWKESNR